MEVIYGINPIKVLLRQQQTGLGKIIIASGRGGSSLKEIIETARQKKIMDPQNLGSIIRTSYCLGANGAVIPADRAAPVTAAVIKASAGSAEQLPIARVTNLSQTIDYLKEREFWVFGADAHEGSNLKEMDFNCNVALVLGGEAKGIRPLVKKKCDFLLSIPLQQSFDSLNVAVAAGIIQYEIFNQRSRIKVIC